MEKVLIAASVASMIGQFNMPNIRLLQLMGYEVHVACNFSNGNTCGIEQINQLKKELEKLQVKYFQIDFCRNVFNIRANKKAYSALCEILKKEQYVFLHCHSPIGGVIGRIAGRKNKVKVIYTAHGFHFYKGAPFINWLLYYPVEKFLSGWTEILITINKEDYIRAKKKFKAKRIAYVPGVGIDTEKFGKRPLNSCKLRQELGIPPSGKWLLSVGELNENKNHEAVIRGIVNLPGAYYTIAGNGELQKYLSSLANELGLSERVKFLGFRNDMEALYDAADIFVFPSKREGLSAALMEAMASGLPVACSRIRGNTDLADSKGGLFFEPDNIESITAALERLVNLPAPELEKMGTYNLKKIKQFDTKKINGIMAKEYKTISPKNWGGGRLSQE